MTVSFFNAQRKAVNITNNFEDSLSSLKGRLILFENKALKPQWLFSAEYNEIITGTTFDIQISMFGKVTKQPALTKNI
jgi:hypothetical protein